jgi:pyruvate carboxylase
MAPLDFEQVKKDLIEKYGNIVEDTDVMSYVMFPKVLEEYLQFKTKFGPVDTLDTRVFFVGPKIAENIDVIKILI